MHCEEIKDEICIWRLVFEKVATLHEIETSWNLDDVMTAIYLLDIKADAQTRQRKSRNGSVPRASN